MNVITAKSPMVMTPSNFSPRTNYIKSIKDLNPAITVRRPLKWLVKGLKEKWNCQESNSQWYGGSCSSVVDHWHSKPEALGSIP